MFGSLKDPLIIGVAIFIVAAILKWANENTK